MFQLKPGVLLMLLLFLFIISIMEHVFIYVENIYYIEYNIIVTHSPREEGKRRNSSINVV